MKKIIFLFLIFFNILKAMSSYEEALLEIKNNNIKKAHSLLLKEKEKGNLDAFYTLGKIYLSKKTKFYNKIKAYNHFVEAANKNHKESQVMVGRFFLHGKIIDKDYEKALYYFEEASKQKYYKANCYIAYMYSRGLGVFTNFGRAHIFAKDEYKRGNKLCIKVWNDYNLAKYPKDKSFKFKKYIEPIK